MKCYECKWWNPIGKRYEGIWRQTKDERNLGLGWCIINPPESGSDKWPETAENDYCGSFEPKMSPLDIAKRKVRLEENRAFNLRSRLDYLKKEIRNTGEEFGISRKKRPERILFLMSQKYFVLKQLEKKERKKGE